MMFSAQRSRLLICKRDHQFVLLLQRDPLGSTRKSHHLPFAKRQYSALPGSRYIRSENGRLDVRGFATSKNPIEPPPQSQIWKRVTQRWNDSLERRPQEAIALFLLSQSSTWLAVYSSLSLSGIAFSPNWAAGWMCARLLKRFRQPLNLAIAAGVVRVLPALAEMKLSPLITGIISVQQPLHQTSLQKKDGIQDFQEQIHRGLRWLEGPIDKYGLAYFLTGKLTFLGTMCVSAILIQQGIQVESVLASWGLSATFGDAIGTVAAASAFNVLFLPIHVVTIVHGIRIMEDAAHSLGPKYPEMWKDDYMHFQSERDRTKAGESEKDTEEASFMVEAMMSKLNMFVMLLSLAVAMLVMERIGFFNSFKKEGEEEPQQGSNTSVSRFTTFRSVESKSEET